MNDIIEKYFRVKSLDPYLFEYKRDPNIVLRFDIVDYIVSLIYNSRVDYLPKLLYIITDLTVRRDKELREGRIRRETLPLCPYCGSKSVYRCHEKSVSYLCSNCNGIFAVKNGKIIKEGGH